MKEYQKIKNYFVFDAKYKTILDYTEPFKTLKDIKWRGTEKVDGTNIRIHWNGHSIEFAGRTDNAQIPPNLLKKLEELFKNDTSEYLFEQVFEDKEAFIFGEGYGPKIQQGGGLYADETNFIVFDVTINGFELNRDNVVDVANKLGLQYVPEVFEGTLDDAIKFVSKHPNSTLNEKHEMEGLILTPFVDIYDKDGHRLKCKIKWKDVSKLGEIK